MKILSARAKPEMKEWRLSLNDFNGTSTLLDDFLLGDKYAKESLNLIQVQDGRWRVRWGRTYYGEDLPANFLGAEEYVKSDGTRHIVAIASDGNAYRSTDGGSWTLISGATFSTTASVTFSQINNYLYICNGSDYLTRYDGSTLSRYSAIAAPSGLSSALTGLSSGSNYNYYKVTAVNDIGETAGSAELTVQTDKTRDLWDASNYVTVSWGAVSGATKYQIYYANLTGNETFLGESVTTSYIDNNSDTANPYFACPTEDTTGAPKFSNICIADGRIWGITPEYRWRVYYSGSGVNVGKFASSFDGGWIDLDKGSREQLVAIVNFRSGKGDSMVTVFSKNPEGTGSIWQIPLVEVAITSDYTAIVPVPAKIAGSFGSSSPLAVIEAGDSFVFPNSLGVFELGNKANVANILSTDELSSNIRPSYRSLNMSKASQFCGIWYDSKVFFSATEGTGENDMIFILDAERRTWNWKWDFGVKRFFHATDSDGRARLLAIPTSGTKLVEISENIVGDFGGTIKTSYVSGLISVSEDQGAFAKVTEAIVTLGRPKGSINFEVLGIEKKKGFSSIATKLITDTLQAGEFWTGDLGEITLMDEEDSPVTYSQAAVKKWQKVGKLVNAIQFHIYSDSAGADYTILNIQAKGFIVPTKHPSSWN